MASPRPILVLVLLGAALLGATFMSARGAREADSDSPSQAAVNTPAKPAAPAATRGTATSGRLSLRVALSGSGPGKSDSTELRASGRFQSAGRTEVPKFQLDASGKAGEESLRVGAVSTGDRGFVLDGDTAYEVSAKAWSQIRSGRRRLAGLAKEAKPDGSAILGVGTKNLLRRLKPAGTAKVDGVQTRHLAGTVDIGGIFKAIGDLQGAAGSGVPQLSESFRRQVEDLLGNPRVDLYIGKEDRILRRFRARVDLQVPPSMRSQFGGLERGRITLDFDLSQVNRPQSVAPPAGAKPLSPGVEQGPELSIGTTALGAGVMAIGLPGLDGVRNAGIPDAFAADGGVKEAGDPQGLPGSLRRALAARRTVVVFFTQSNSADDEAVGRSVGALRRGGRVSVFRANLSDVSRYRQVIAEDSVTRSPSIVIIGPDRRARVIEGYVDARSLAQEVADAR
jgi:hypothetical protein